VIRPRELSRSIDLFPVRTPTLPPATHTNSYAIGTREVLLVEPSTPDEREQRAWIEWGRALPSTGRQPIAIFTHYHADHVGGLDVLSRELNLAVWAHEETARRVGETKVLRLLVDGEAIVLDGLVPESWQILETPRHAWGHLCLWEERTRTVVVGDMVASVGTILIAPGDGDMRLYLASLARLAALNARLALPAHGAPIDSPTSLFERYIEHRLRREEKVYSALPTPTEPAATPSALVPRAYDDAPPYLWPLARLSVEAHLVKLVEEGRAQEREGRFVKMVV
jgi:ribonuclease/clavin/mitogillin